MDGQNKNLILATALSFVVILVWFLLFPPPDAPLEPAQTEAPVAQSQADGTLPAVETPGRVTANAAAEAPSEDIPRVAIDTSRLEGSISLLGGRIDDLRLKDYRASVEPDSEIVTVLRPVGQADAYYALYGWAAASGVAADAVPGPDTLWSLAEGATLTIDTPVVLTWTNGAGLTFERRISVDEDFMFDIAQTVRNDGADTAALRAYGLLRRHGEPTDIKNFFILHEGMIRMSDGTLEETDYDGMTDYTLDERERAQAERIEVAENGWIGFTDHYWMTTLIPQPGTAFRSTAKYFDTRDVYQVETVLPPVTVAPGESATVETRLFAGAKEWETIRDYQNNPGLWSRLFGAEIDPSEPEIQGFVDSIDWGWFFFLTKPIFAVLHYLNQLIGNMGWAIIALTFLIKALLFPLAYKSYASMAKMKELQPEMEKIKESAGDDRQKLQQEMMALYKKEKVNPASGCLPILMQIPIFFSLYKVIFVTLELRHAPFIGWLRDLSAPDPSSLYNLFGLLPWAPPEPGSILALVFIGALPILLGVSMWLQQKLNPAPADPTQQMIFAWMPWVFMFMLGGFASGLVIYWIANNTITFIQQYLIMRSQGYTPDVFGNIRKSFSRKAVEKD
ncbi:membrane protein insertase YidC [Poseidonocella sedimentorum]|uniref:Membrane protein insertase YidC n=1 Tax=Poseidonocella sedimentorum TaxID=871652 RepID=A0A1I6DMM8_9RHOB|nr:membrane protein insertase YidC [Poseidonocella sedimentorum]SFR06646.1 protein translocase subunit yidC [Poseidonocella sedimentorum]